MQLPHSADVALRCLVVLADGTDRHMTVSDLAGDINIPQRYVGRIIQRLASLGWVETTRGVGGGIRISEAGRVVTPAEVIGVWGELRPPVDCREPWCPLLARGCRLHDLLIDAQAAFTAILGTRSIGQLA